MLAAVAAGAVEAEEAAAESGVGWGEVELGRCCCGMGEVGSLVDDMTGRVGVREICARSESGRMNEATARREETMKEKGKEVFVSTLSLL